VLPCTHDARHAALWSLENRGILSDYCPVGDLRMTGRRGNSMAEGVGIVERLPQLHKRRHDSCLVWDAVCREFDHVDIYPADCSGLLQTARSMGASGIDVGERGGSPQCTAIEHVPRACSVDATALTDNRSEKEHSRWKKRGVFLLRTDTFNPSIDQYQSLLRRALFQEGSWLGVPEGYFGLYAST
jgi:hypothetical protein